MAGSRARLDSPPTAAYDWSSIGIIGPFVARLHVVSDTGLRFPEGNAAIVVVGMSQDEAGRLMDVLRRARYSAAAIAGDPPEDAPDLALVRPVFGDGEEDKAPWPRRLDDLGVPVIALIPAGRLDFIDRATATGAAEVLIMPPNPQEILLRVRKVLRLAAFRHEAARLGSGPGTEGAGAAGS